MNSSCDENNINAKLVSFINIQYNPDQGEYRKDELEGLDVGEEIGGYDLRLVVLHNIDQLVGVEHHSVLHFATGDIDNFAEGYTYNGYGYFPQGNKIRIAAKNKIVPVCGNGIVETGEVCDSDSIKCTSIDSDYISGTAVCNSTCSGYDESSCEASDGWF